MVYEKDMAENGKGFPPGYNIAKRERIWYSLENVQLRRAAVVFVGRIDPDIYRCVTRHIMTGEVVITEERIAHIQDHHPGDFERYFSYFSEIIRTPDYILEANRPNSAFLLKEIHDSGEHFKMILRIAVADDPSEYRNSIITFWKIDEKRYLRYLRTKKILYKSE